MKDWQVEVEKWKRGSIVLSAELGGIGPGYEQAIQVLLWEIMARWPFDELPEPVGSHLPPAYADHVERVVNELNDACCGFSGAQVGAAKSTAWQFMKYGYADMMAKLDRDRIITVSKRFPHVPAKATGGSE